MIGHQIHAKPKMKQPEDKVWGTITDSAKKRFDYENFRQVFAGMGEDQDVIAENVLNGVTSSMRTARCWASTAKRVKRARKKNIDHGVCCSAPNVRGRAGNN